MITKSFGHICYLNEHGLSCFPRELFPGHNHVLGEEISPKKNLNCVPLRSNHALLGSNLNHVPLRNKCVQNFV